MTTNIAMIGYGAMGRAHAMGYRDIVHHYGLKSDAVQVVAVATTRTESARQAADELGCATASTNYHELIARADVDVIDICTPHDSHEEIVTAAARAGKHIYCEKPLARTFDEAQRMAAAVRAANVKCALTFNFRFFPCVLRAKHLIDEGFCGRVFSFHGRYFRASYIDPKRPMSWRLRKAQAGGGVLIDSGAHAVDFAQWLISGIEHVRATVSTPYAMRPVNAGSSETAVVDVEDVALVQLRCADGALGTLDISRVATGATNDAWFEVRGDKGALRFTLEEPNWLHVFDTRASAAIRGFTRVETVARYDGALMPDWSQPVGISRTHAECQYRFLRSIWDDTPSSPGIDDGLRVQAIVDAAYRSAASEAWEKVEL